MIGVGLSMQSGQINKLKYRVGILGCPSMPDVKWNKENLSRLKDMGFNTVQLNIAWLCRPADEPLNLEDVIVLTDEKRLGNKQTTPFYPDQDLKRIEQRRSNLRHRIQISKELGLRTLFHFGAPFNPHCYDGSTPTNCLLDGRTMQTYVYLLKKFAQEFPGVDDVLIYTYDQDAWLCSEFGDCVNCAGIPLHKRVVPFINTLGKTCNEINPNGQLWWEPWELSSGQILKSIETLDEKSVGLSVHSNIAEVQATMPVDRWLKNVCTLAGQKNIPIIVEHWLGAASEELEPYVHLSHPQVVLRALRTIFSLHNICGIKEYYGLIPNKIDTNLRATSLFFADPCISEKDALAELSKSYAAASTEIIEFWRLCSEGMELFPWDVSWFIREIGKSDPVHSMSAAMIRGQQAHTPSWESGRRSIFMKCDDNEVDPWALEDVQLRCELSAQRIEAALKLGQNIAKSVPLNTAATFNEELKELRGLLKRIRAYAFHLRETNLANCMRKALEDDRIESLQFIVQEMFEILKVDQTNQGQEEPIGSAIKLLKENVQAFLEEYFQIETDKRSKGIFSLTSR